MQALTVIKTERPTDHLPFQLNVIKHKATLIAPHACCAIFFFVSFYLPVSQVAYGCVEVHSHLDHSLPGQSVACRIFLVINLSEC